MASEDRHADNFAKTDAASTQTATPAGPQVAKAVDNAEQAARAIAERERTFTTGDDGLEPAPVAPAAAPTSQLDAAIRRVQSLARPSPFGAGQFPPLPMPPRMK